jgi:hypothetical protein
VTTRYKRGDPHMHVCEAMIALGGPAAEYRYCRPSPAQQRALWREQSRTDLDNARRHIEACGADGQRVARQVRILVRQHRPAIMRRRRRCTSVAR